MPRTASRTPAPSRWFFISSSGPASAAERAANRSWGRRSPTPQLLFLAVVLLLLPEGVLDGHVGEEADVGAVPGQADRDRHADHPLDLVQLADGVADAGVDEDLCGALPKAKVVDVFGPQGQRLHEKVEVGFGLPEGAGAEVVGVEVAAGRGQPGGQQHVDVRRVGGARVEVVVEPFPVPADGEVELVADLAGAQARALVPRGQDEAEARGAPQKFVAGQELV